MSVDVTQSLARPDSMPLLGHSVFEIKHNNCIYFVCTLGAEELNIVHLANCPCVQPYIMYRFPVK